MKTQQEIQEKYEWYKHVVANPKVYLSVAKEYVGAAQGLAWVLEIPQEQFRKDFASFYE